MIMDDEFIVMYNEETGMWEQKPEPFAVVEYPTEEDFEHLKNVLDFYKKHRWVSVKDRLPYAEYGESDSVLTISESGIQEVLYFDGSCWCHPTGEVRESVFHITHWMPLPEPPEGE